MSKPLTIFIQSVSGDVMKFSMDGCNRSEDAIRGEIAKAGIPENLQILAYNSKVLYTDKEYEDDEETTLDDLLSGLGVDVTTLTMSLLKRDPIVAEWLANIQSLSCSSLEEAPEIVRGSAEVLLSAVRRVSTRDMDPDDVFQYASPELLGDRAFMQKAVKYSGYCLTYAAEPLKADRDIVAAAVRENGFSLQFAAESLKADEEIVMEAVRNYGESMEHAADTLKSNRDFVTKAVEADADALGYVNKALVSRDLVLSAVKSKAMAFKWASDFRGDREIALEAVQNDGEAVEFASNELKADKEIVGTAAMSYSRAIEHAGDVLKNDKDFLWACVKVNPETIQSVGQVVTEDDQLMRIYAKLEKKMQMPSYLDFASSRLKNDKGYVMDAIKFYAIMSASEEMKQDGDLWLQCLDDHDGGCLWEDCPQSLKEDWEFAV